MFASCALETGDESAAVPLGLGEVVAAVLIESGDEPSSENVIAAGLESARTIGY